MAERSSRRSPQIGAHLLKLVQEFCPPKGGSLLHPLGIEAPTSGKTHYTLTILHFSEEDAENFFKKAMKLLGVNSIGARAETQFEADEHPVGIISMFPKRHEICFSTVHPDGPAAMKLFQDHLDHLNELKLRKLRPP